MTSRRLTWIVPAIAIALIVGGIWWYLRTPTPVIAKIVRLGGEAHVYFASPRLDWAEAIGFRRLESVNIVEIDSDQFTDADLAQLARFESLGHLEIRSNAITDDGIHALAVPPSDSRHQIISGLTIDCPKVTDDGLMSLQGVLIRKLVVFAGPDVQGRFLHDHPFARQRILQFLSLHGDAIGDDVVPAISQFTVEDVDLSNTQVSDASLHHFTKMTNLVYINLKGTAVTRAGVQRLRASLPPYVTVVSDWPTQKADGHIY